MLGFPSRFKEAVVVNQRHLVDKVLARYPEEFTGMLKTTPGNRV